MILEKVQEMKQWAQDHLHQGKTIGLVPTMGYLHEGHLSLIRRAKEENDYVIVSVFVNPTQFGPNEDYDKYPRSLQQDSHLCENMEVDILFYPSVEEMYPTPYYTYVEVEKITNKLCGASRPGHFRGVTTVVNKLFNIVKPNRAYFGQKDAQQIVVIQQMVKDLNMDVEVVSCSIVREADGLALSSRNSYLNEEERKAALILSQCLFQAKERMISGEKSACKIKKIIEQNIQKESLVSIDYVSIVDATSLEDIEKLEKNILIALAVKIGNTRLIDNIQIKNIK